MNIIIAYESRNFFGDREYREDERTSATLRDAQKCWRKMTAPSSGTSVSIKAGNYVFMYDSLSDAQTGVVSVYHYPTPNDRNICKLPREEAKRLFYSLFK